MQQQQAAAEQLAKVQRKSDWRRMRAKAAEARLAQVAAELASGSGAMGKQGAAAAQGTMTGGGSTSGIGSKKRKMHAVKQRGPAPPS